MTIGDGREQDIPAVFDALSLSEPTEVTRRTFELLAEGVVALGDVDTFRGLNVNFASEDGLQMQSVIEILCQERTTRSATPEEERIAQIEFSFIVEGRRHFFGSSREKAAAHEVIDAICEGLREEEAKWLRKLWLTKLATPEEELPDVVRELLDDAPFPAVQSRRQYIDLVAGNGTRIAGHSLSGSDELIDFWPEQEAIFALYVTDANNTEFEYSRYKNGEERLFVKKPGERTDIEVDLYQPAIIVDLEMRVSSVASYPYEEDERRHLQGIEERAQARRLGVDKVTEGSLKDLTVAINDALNSEVVAVEQDMSDLEEE